MAEKEKVDKIFQVSGEFLEKGKKKTFTKELKAFNTNYAAEKAVALMGSKHKIKRRHITILEVKEVKGEK